MDIKRFDDLTAFLTSSVYLSGWPGIRRSTTTAIYRDGEEVPSFICEDVYVDGGHGTRGNDCFDRAFTDILGIRFEGERVAVRVKGVHSEHEIFCVPPSK